MGVLKTRSDLTPQKISVAFFGAGVGVEARKDEVTALLALVGRPATAKIANAAFNIANRIPEIRAGEGNEFVQRPFRKYLEHHPELLPSGNRMP